MPHYGFANHFYGGRWSWSGHIDVEILKPTNQRLQLRYARWGLAQAMVRMGLRKFISLEAYTKWNEAGVPVDMEILDVQ